MKYGIQILKAIGAMAMVFSVVLLVGGLFARICMKKKINEEQQKLIREKRIRRQ